MIGRRALAGILLRGTGALLVLTAILFLAGSRVLTPFVPVYVSVAEWLLPGHDCRVSLVDAPDGSLSSGLIRLDARTATRVRVSDEVTLAPGMTMYANTDLSTGLIPLVLISCLLLAWPAPRPIDRLTLIITGLAMVLLVEAITVPVLLAGTLEAIEARMGGSDAPLRSPLSLWYLALNNGGAFVAALAGVVGALAIARPRPA